MLASFQAVGHVWEDKDLFQRAVTTGARVVQLSFQTQNVGVSVRQTQDMQMNGQNHSKS